MIFSAVFSSQPTQVTPDGVRQTDMMPAPHHFTQQQTRLSSRSGGSNELDWQDFEITWYSPEGGWGDGTVTRSGAKVEEGTTIAVDTSLIPLGSKVAIQFKDGTTHIFTAEDTGGAIRGQHIDIFVWSNDQARTNGREILKVAILKRGDGHVG